MRCSAKLAIATIALGWGALSARAQVVWTGSGNWTKAANWSTGAPPGAADSAVFNGTSNSTSKVNANATVGEIDFTNASGAVTISSGSSSYTLTLNGVASGGTTYGIENDSSSAATIKSALALGGSQTWESDGGGGIIFKSTIDLGANTLTLTAVNSGDTLSTGSSSVISGTGAITQTGAGTVSFGNVANTFSGGYTLAGGTVQVGNSASFGTGALTLASGTLSFTANLTLANDLTLTGPVTFANANASSSRTLTFSSNYITGSGASPSLTLASLGTGSTTLVFTGSGFNFTAPISLGANTQLSSGNSSGTQTFSGVISGAGGFTENASGGVTLLSAANTYTGTTSITAGTLQFGVNNALPAATDVTISSGATLNLNGFSGSIDSLAGAGSVTFGTNGALTLTGAVSTSFSGQLTGDASTSFTQNGSGSLTLTAAQTGFAGNFVIQQGTVQANNDASFGTGLLTLAGGTLASTTSRTLANDLSVTGPATIANTNTSASRTFTFSSNNITSSGASPSLTLTGTGTGSTTLAFTGSGFNFGASINLSANTQLTSGNSSGTQTFSGVISGAGAFTENASGGVTILSGANTYSGGTTLTAGELSAGSDTAFGTGTLTLGSGTLSASGGAHTLANTVLQTANATIGGTQNLTLTGSYAESTTNTLTVTNTGLTTFNGATLTLDQGTAARTLSLAVDAASGGLVINNVIQDGTGGGDILKITGTGALTLNGANTYSGGTTLQSGTLTVGNDAALGTGGLTLAGGTLQAGGGAHTLANAVTLTADSTLGGSQDLTFTGGLTQSSSHTLTVTNTGATTFSTGALTPTGTLTFNIAGGSGGVTVNSAIQTGSLALNGAGVLTLTNNANTYTGTTTLAGGTLRFGVANALPSGTAVTLASGATLDLNGQSGTIASLAGTGGTVNLAGGGALTLAGNASTTFAGTIASDASSVLTKNGTGDFTLGASQDFAGNLILAGGTLSLGGFNQTISTLTVTGNSILDFSGGPTILNVTNLIVDAGATLTIENWTDTIDYFYAANNPGAAVLGNIQFSGFTPSDTQWLPYEDGPGPGHQVTPVPEPAAYGAVFLGLTLALAGCFHLRQDQRR